MSHAGRAVVRLLKIALAVSAATALLAIAALISPSSPVDASHSGGMDALSVDVGVTGNGATFLGPLDECIEVTAPTIQIDVTATNIPPSNRIVAYTYRLVYDSLNLGVTLADHQFLIESLPGSNLLVVDNTSNPGDYIASVSDINSAAAESGSGILTRFTLDVSGATPGVYALRLASAAHLDELNQTFIPDTLNHARIAVGGADCSATPAPTGTPLPATPTPLPTPSPAPGRMDAMSIDMDPTSNDAVSLGPLDLCIEVSAGDAVTIDITATNIPASRPLIVFRYTLLYPAPLVISAADHDFLINALPGSTEAVIAEVAPDSDGSFVVEVVDLVAFESGSGVLSRLVIDTTGATPGIYPLNLRDASHIDQTNTANSPGLLNNGYLAIDNTCLNASFPPAAVGGITGLLDADGPAPASESRSDNIGYIAALAGIVGAALFAGGWYARRRWLR